MNDNVEMQAVQAKIQAIYDDFAQFWMSGCGRTKAYLRDIFRESKCRAKHALGNFVILYTPVRLRPDLMIIANYPSWFHERDPDQAMSNLSQVAARVPTVNSYIKHGHVFGNTLKDIFFDLDEYDLLATCVGLNRLWIQAGDKIGKLLTDERREECQMIQEKCTAGTLRIIQLLKPKAIALIGKAATEALEQRIGDDITVKCCAYPQSGERAHQKQSRLECTRALAELLAEASIG